METTPNKQKLEEEALQAEQDLVKLFEHPGWVRIREHIESEITNKMEELVIEKTPEGIQRLQAEIKAYREVPKFIMDSVALADTVRELKLEETLFVPDLN